MARPRKKPASNAKATPKAQPAKKADPLVRICNPAITKGEQEITVPTSEVEGWLSVGWKRI